MRPDADQKGTPMTQALRRRCRVAVCAALLGGSAWLRSARGARRRLCRMPRRARSPAATSAGRSRWSTPTGKTVTDADVLTKPTLVYFGYTFCPDVCPFDMARNAEAVDILDERGIDVTPVFISDRPRPRHARGAGRFRRQHAPQHDRPDRHAPNRSRRRPQAYKTYLQASSEPAIPSSTSSTIRPSPI